jgi:hypothetical protein
MAKQTGKPSTSQPPVGATDESEDKWAQRQYAGERKRQMDVENTVYDLGLAGVKIDTEDRSLLEIHQFGQADRTEYESLKKDHARRTAQEEKQKAAQQQRQQQGGQGQGQDREGPSEVDRRQNFAIGIGLMHRTISNIGGPGRVADLASASRKHWG